MGLQNEPGGCCPHKLMLTCCDGTSTQAQLCQGWLMPVVAMPAEIPCPSRRQALAGAFPDHDRTRREARQRRRWQHSLLCQTPECLHYAAHCVQSVSDLRPSEEMVSSSHPQQHMPETLINRGVLGRGHRICPKPAHKHTRLQTEPCSCFLPAEAEHLLPLGTGGHVPHRLGISEAGKELSQERSL